MELKYRADIDGLRAIAVLAVLFFHTNVPGFSGGFVGVDVFFVISGYLITSIILKDIKAKQFSITGFYERRIRRIFPALFPVIAFVLVVGACFFDASAFKDLGQSIAATTLFSSNILFWRESGYFAAPSLQKPLLHTWSLAVEEQFYIFFPLALMVIHRYLKGKYFLWVVIAFIISLAASIYGVTHNPGAAFYLVPTRAWELMVGSILTFGTLPVLTKDWQRNALTFTGLALILFSVFFYTEATSFPGIAALVPVIGSGLIIYSGGGGGKYVAQRVLTAKPLVFIGLISYSLYLWHWPFVAFTKYFLFRPFTAIDSAAIIFTSLLFGSFSWMFIEKPFRGKTPLLKERKRLFGFACVVMVVAVGIGGSIHLLGGIPERINPFYPEMVSVIDRAKNDPIWNLHGEWEKRAKKIGEGMTPLIVGNDLIKPSFALVGDSHARAIIPALERQAIQSGTAGYIITSSSTPFLQGISIISSIDNGLYEPAYNKNVLTFIKNRKSIQTVILVARWGVYIHGQWTAKNENPIKFTLTDTTGQYPECSSNAKILGIGLSRTINALREMNRKVILVSDVPEIGYDVSRIYMMQTRFPFFEKGIGFSPSIAEYKERQKEANAMLEEFAKTPGVTLIRPEKRMFDNQGKVRIIANGELLYIDDDHLSTAGALYVAPVFDQLFKEMGRNQSANNKVSAE